MKVRNQKKNKSSIALVLVLVAIMAATLGACSKNDSSKDSQITSNTPVVEEESTEISEEVQQPEAEALVEPIEDVVEPTEETTPEEPKVEMVDFETWAKQEGNDEVCLVVWNEELGVQEIMPTFQETEEIYQVQEGDRFAIPYRESIFYVEHKDESLIAPNTEYLEISLEKGEVSQVIIIFKNENGEDENKNYFLQFQ